MNAHATDRCFCGLVSMYDEAWGGVIGEVTDVSGRKHTTEACWTADGSRRGAASDGAQTHRALADEIAHDLVEAPDDGITGVLYALALVDAARDAALACLTNGGTVDDARQAAAERLADLNAGG